MHEQPLTIKIRNTTPLQRHTYRNLRHSGFTRHDANLIILGMQLNNG